MISIPMGIMYLPTGMFCRYTRWCVYMQECSVHSLIQYYTHLHVTFSLHRKFLYAGRTCILASMIYTCGNVFIPSGVMCIPSGTICIPTGTISNQIPVGDTCLWIFLHRVVNYIPARINFYCDPNCHLLVKFYPMGTYFYHGNWCFNLR